MGSPESEEGRDSDEKQHWVTVSAFEIGRFEVTQGQWKAVMGTNPSHFQNGDHYPVELVFALLPSYSFIRPRSGRRFFG